MSSLLEPASPDSTGGRSRRRNVGGALPLLLLPPPKSLELPGIAAAEEEEEEDNDDEEGENEECACELSRATLARLKSAHTKQKCGSLPSPVAAKAAWRAEMRAHVCSWCKSFSSLLRT